MGGGKTSFVGFIAVALLFVAAFLILVAFAAPNWLQIDEEKKVPSMKFRNLGLWANCFTNFHDPYTYDPYLTTSYEGCRWIYAPVLTTLTDIREYILPSFFVPVQVCFSICFLTAIACVIMTLVYLSKFNAEDEGLVPYLIILGMFINLSALLGAVAVIIFGSMSSTRSWAPEWQFNFLGWTFVVAVIAVVLEQISGIFFLAEAMVQWRRKRSSGFENRNSRTRRSNRISVSTITREKDPLPVISQQSTPKPLFKIPAGGVELPALRPPSLFITPKKEEEKMVMTAPPPTPDNGSKGKDKNGLKSTVIKNKSAGQKHCKTNRFTGKSVLKYSNRSSSESESHKESPI